MVVNRSSVAAGRSLPGFAVGAVASLAAAFASAAATITYVGNEQDTLAASYGLSAAALLVLTSWCAFRVRAVLPATARPRRALRPGLQVVRAPSVDAVPDVTAVEGPAAPVPSRTTRGPLREPSARPSPVPRPRSSAAGSDIPETTPIAFVVDAPTRVIPQSVDDRRGRAGPTVEEPADDSADESGESGVARGADVPEGGASARPRPRRCLRARTVARRPRQPRRGATSTPRVAGRPRPGRSADGR